MDNVIVVSILVLAGIAVLAAIILYVIARKFKVEEDPRIDLVSEVLPGANCGGCGFAGCRNFAESCVKDLSGKYCTAGGADVMAKVASILGGEAAAPDPKVAVVRCGGSKDCRPRTNAYEGAQTCAIVAATYGGETGCAFGCIGLGDCVSVCSFGAIKINPATGLPEVDGDKCTACGACAKACPKLVIELRKKAVKLRKVYVSCVNKDKGPVAKKACSNACIGCGKCAKTCPFEAITVENNLAFIDSEKCKMCRKCVEQCPTGAIKEENFPPRKPKADAAEAPKPQLNQPSGADKVNVPTPPQSQQAPNANNQSQSNDQQQ